MKENCQAHKISGIYKIVNKISGKYYVGSSDNILGTSGRWKEHINDLNANRHDNDYLQKSWNKYKDTNFDFIIIETLPNEITRKELLLVEQKYLDLAKKEGKEKCYNLSYLAAGGGMLGHHHSEESKKKISEKMKGRPSPMKGRKRPEWITKYLAENYLKGEKNARWKSIDDVTKNILFNTYQKFGSQITRQKAREFGLGNNVFKRLVSEFHTKMNIPNGKSYRRIHHKFMNEETKKRMFLVWKEGKHTDLVKFSKEQNVGFHLIYRTLKELRDRGYKKVKGKLYLNDKLVLT